MMSPKMIAFLTKLGIEDVDAFDFSFGKLSKNIKTNVIQMQIIKETPWSFDLLDYFISHWPGIEYSISFAYSSEILGSDVLSLLKGMFENK